MSCRKREIWRQETGGPVPHKSKTFILLNWTPFFSTTRHIIDLNSWRRLGRQISPRLLISQRHVRFLPEVEILSIASHRQPRFIKCDRDNKKNSERNCATILLSLSRQKTVSESTKMKDEKKIGLGIDRTGSKFDRDNVAVSRSIKLWCSLFFFLGANPHPGWRF